MTSTQPKETTEGQGGKGRDPADLSRGTMSFGKHLDELRGRLIISIVAVALCTIGFLANKDFVTSLVIRPYHVAWGESFSRWYDGPFEAVAVNPKLPEHVKDCIPRVRAAKDALLAGKGRSWDFIDLQTLGFPLPRTLMSITPLQDIVIYMLGAVLAGLVVASPIVILQIWKFIAAGLYKRERGAVLAFLPFSIGLFLGGCLFGYFSMVPNALFYLMDFANPELVAHQQTVRDYFRFLFVLTVALGCVFQIPIVMMGLVKFGICNPSTFTRYWRHSVLCMCVISALLTPPDPVTMVLMAGPMIMLYLFGILLSKMSFKKRIDLSAFALPCPNT